MLINCDNKGCMKQTEALLDPQTQEVICQECNNPIKNISAPMIRTLKSFGQILRDTKKAFMMACSKCNANRQVVMNNKDQTVCNMCGNEIKVHNAMKLAIKESGNKFESKKKK